MEDQFSEEQREKMLQIMATEHSVLQAGRSATIFETGGRITVFLGTVSSALIALAFVGQISRLGTAFFAFALVLLPTLFFLVHAQSRFLVMRYSGSHETSHLRTFTFRRRARVAQDGSALQRRFRPTPSPDTACKLSRRKPTENSQ